MSRAVAAIRSMVKKNFPLTCASYLLLNYLEGRRYKKGNVQTHSGMRHADLDPALSVEYIKEVFSDYKSYGKIERFHGRVVEIGPGDNAGVAMLIAADGAESVDMVDRYYSARDPKRQSAVYKALVSSSENLRSLYSAADLFREETFPRLKRHYGPDASAEEFFATREGYDFIVSRAVMEHTYDPELAIARMAHALSPGGVMIHQVDLRDHGMFTPVFHELKFLEVPEPIYSRMTRSSGRPNRVLIDRYRSTLDASGLDYTILVTALVAVGDVTPHLPYDAIPEASRRIAEECVEAARPKLARRFQLLAARDLAVSGILIIARRPDRIV